MPDEPRPTGPGPEEEESVRRLLAAEGATPEPLPQEVADRLERALADLSSGRGTRPPAEDATVTPLPSPGPGRGRRRLATLLVAAAAVSVVGLGVGTVVTGQQGAGESSTAARDAAGGAAGDSQMSAEGPARLTGRLPEVHRATFAADARRLAARLPAPAAGSQEADKPVAPAHDCAQPRLGPGDVAVPVLLDGHAATLVLRSPEGGTSVAQAYGCAVPGRPVATARVRAR